MSVRVSGFTRVLVASLTILLLSLTLICQLKQFKARFTLGCTLYALVVRVFHLVSGRNLARQAQLRNSQKHEQVHHEVRIFVSLVFLRQLLPLASLCYHLWRGRGWRSGIREELPQHLTEVWTVWVKPWWRIAVLETEASIMLPVILY
ncbi:hypothetical protein B0T09DRAFT_339983 [Sordaria sp. MPI-SDFR-AT-0083]|nr:hypothetical protein B0T09DRAFT_339983 [Sordaria sp. MPI-SDFR-AT-0083]